MAKINVVSVGRERGAADSGGRWGNDLRVAGGRNVAQPQAVPPVFVHHCQHISPVGGYRGAHRFIGIGDLSDAEVLEGRRERTMRERVNAIPRRGEDGRRSNRPTRKSQFVLFPTSNNRRTAAVGGLC